MKQSFVYLTFTSQLVYKLLREKMMFFWTYTWQRAGHITNSSTLCGIEYIGRSGKLLLVCWFDPGMLPPDFTMMQPGGKLLVASSLRTRNETHAMRQVLWLKAHHMKLCALCLRLLMCKAKAIKTWPGKLGRLHAILAESRIQDTLHKCSHYQKIMTEDIDGLWSFYYVF